MEHILVYCSAKSSRLEYVLDWVLRERLQLSYTITHNEAEANRAPFVIAYGKALPKAVSIPDTGLLWQTGTAGLAPEAGTWLNSPTLFTTQKKTFSLPFDLFSAIFYLLSRYEEYYAYKPDKHGRYPAKSSILYKRGWLQRPLIDEWICELRKLLLREGMAVPPMPFVYQPTYDIDIAYSHLYKGLGRIAGAYLRALLKLDLKQITERTDVLKRKQKDPYDSFRWLRQLHDEYDFKPTYFVLTALRTTAFDKNIHPEHPAMTRVIRNLAKEGNIGIHPSYYSGTGTAMLDEYRLLERIAGSDINISRQHFIRIQLPDTYRGLLVNGIQEDYSMGYGSHLGFRAGTGSSFLWYDLQKEAATKLRVHPFCFMDTTAHYEQKLNVNEAFDKLNTMAQLLEQTGSTLITVFHNFSLGTAREWKGWRHAYESFLQEKTPYAKERAEVS
ncbi:MAG: polysaccharide deacetylase family protein [Bacteroidota bacterium]